MKSLLSLMALFSTLGCFGCATTPVNLPVLRPAELDVAGLQRIAVLEFQGPAPYAEQVRNDLSAAIAAGGRRDVPPPHIVREMIPASVPYRGQGIDVRTAVEQARHAGFDAIVVGEVVYDSNAKDQLVIGNPRIEARIETQLIDVYTGNVRGETSASRKWRGELSRHERADNNERKVTEKMLAVCVAETAGKLATTTAHIEVALAAPHDGDDKSAMQAGREAAEQNEWALAAQHFERARAANPTSHAAMYNLALACEAQFNFAAARHWHSEALRLHEDEDYRTALARVDNSWRDYDLALRQTQPRPQAQVMQAASEHPRW